MKERMITRTIKNNRVFCKFYDTEIDEITTTWIDLTGSYSNNDLFKACEKRLSGSSLKLLKIIEVQIEEKLFAMPESTFMLYAVEVPEKERKEIEED